ncbi:zinc finger protein 227-like [Octopus bimaculoides]|uniref:C2H2-type domain-containing protein n=1 Tax=Octopus bimaculoides TaxID=37653 RepID=A0A0L8FVV8_OCTBM|nr:zinc finger protein 227-like [Octopus bimaculoides]
MLKRKNNCSANCKAVILGQQKFCTLCEKDHGEDLTFDLETVGKGKPFRCQFCNQAFSDSCLFVKHMELHLGKSLYRCEFCGTLFGDFLELITHRKDHLMFACNHCDKRFGDEESRKKHVNRLHEDPLRVSKKKFSLRIDEILQKNTAVLKPFHSCDICFENFPQLSQLLIHKKTHTKEKPHKCNICGKSFKHDNVLKVHQQLHEQQFVSVSVSAGDSKHASTLCNQNLSHNRKTAPQQTQMQAKEKPKATALKENSDSKPIPVLLATQLGPTGVALSEHTEPAIKKRGPVIENLTPAHLGAKTVYLLSKPQTQLNSAINICPPSPLLNIQRNSVIQQVRHDRPVLVAGQNVPVKILKSPEKVDSAGFLSNGVSLEKKQQQLGAVAVSDPKNNISTPKVNGKSNNGVVSPVVMENYLILKLPSTETNPLKIPNYGAIVQSHPCSVASPVVTAPTQTAEAMEISIADSTSLHLNNSINYSEMKTKACKTKSDREPDCNKSSNLGPNLERDQEEQPLSLVKSEPAENTEDKGFENFAKDTGKIESMSASVEMSSQVVMHSETPSRNGEENKLEAAVKADVEVEQWIKRERDSSDYEMVVESDAVPERREVVPQSSVKRELAERAPVEERGETRNDFVLAVKQEVENEASSPRIPEGRVIDAAEKSQTMMLVEDKPGENAKQEKGNDGKNEQKEGEENKDGREHLCIHCGKNHSKALVEFLAQSPKDKPFKCQICGDIFSIGCLFIRHINSHEEVEGSILYQCEVCGNIFEQFLSLFSHRQAKHHRLSNYNCTQCRRAFLCESDLKRHRRLVHFVEKAFVCDYCCRSFSQKCNLVFHRRTHTGEQPYGCDHCGKRFARPGNLSIHLRTHNMVSKLKMHRCNTCDKPFKTRQQLKFHAQLMHHNYHDDYQDRNHDNRSGRGSSGGSGSGSGSSSRGGGSSSDMPFKCDICGDSYSNCKDLKEHVQLHQSGDKQTYRCNSCGRQFLHSYMLLRHKLSHKGRYCQSAKVQSSRTAPQP